jgi:type II secretory pathway component PulL
MQQASVFRRRVLVLVGSTVAFLLSYQVCSAQDVEDATREACRPEALRLCGQYIPDVDRITECMTENFKQVNAQCQAAMIKESARARARSQGRRTGSPSEN